MVAPQSDTKIPSNSGPPDDDQFVCLFVQNQRLLFAYLRTALGNPADAEEVLQETSVILWRERHRFLMGTNFVNWAITIAQNQVRRFRRGRKHIPQFLNEDLLDQLAAEVVAKHDLMEARHRALDHCLQALNERDRSLVRAAYSVKATKKSVSEQMGIAPNALYKALNRIRQRLLKCIERQLSAEGRT